jgi:hypothetical protein
MLIESPPKMEFSQLRAILALRELASLAKAGRRIGGPLAPVRFSVSTTGAYGNSGTPITW